MATCLVKLHFKIWYSLFLLQNQFLTPLNLRNEEKIMKETLCPSSIVRIEIGIVQTIDKVLIKNHSN
jgi:hypothetical protein